MNNLSPDPQLRVQRRWGWWRLLPVLVPWLVLVSTGVRGLDFGLHWDERPWQIGPTKHMVQAKTPLPGYYNYPSFDYWLNLAVLSPDVVTSREPGEHLGAHLVRVLDSPAFLLRLRIVYLTIGSLALVWVYLVVVRRGGSWLEALFAAALLGGSWEVAYHLRWVASDGMLMQFAALTVLLATIALRARRWWYLFAAAVTAGLGFGTKYPGGLLVLPVIVAGFFFSADQMLSRRLVLLVKLAVVFAGSFLLCTPAALLRTNQLVQAVLYEVKHYATGHGGHTVGRGIGHMGRMLDYFSTAFFSPHLAVALLLFALAVVGVVSLLARDRRESIVLLIFPAAYLLYFSTQGTMVVRNLLAVAPFLAIAAARGAAVVFAALGGSRDTWAARSMHRRSLQVAWIALLGGAACLNAAWLISSAESIAARHTDRFVRDAATHVRAHPDARFFLSPRVEHDLAVVAPTLANTTEISVDADFFMLYAREGMRRWHDWPASRRGLTQIWFGPREVNFDIYPNWWGDDRIIVIDRRRAEEIGLHIAGASEDATPPAETNLLSPLTETATTTTAAPASALYVSWALPSIDSRVLVPRSLVESIIGPLVRGPVSGGWELDGTGCTYVARDGLVVNLTIISTAAFDLERHDQSSLAVSGVGRSAYVARAGALGDLRLFSRSREHAVVVHVTGEPREGKTREDVAMRFAASALDRLDAAALAANLPR